METANRFICLPIFAMLTFSLFSCTHSDDGPTGNNIIYRIDTDIPMISLVSYRNRDGVVTSHSHSDEDWEKIVYSENPFIAHLNVEFNNLTDLSQPYRLEIHVGTQLKAVVKGAIAAQSGVSHELQHMITD